MASRKSQDLVAVDAVSGSGVAPQAAFRVAGFVVDPAANELIADDGTRMRIEARAMDVLALLHRQAGEVLSSRYILDAVWGDVAVSAHSVAIVISDLRRAFDDDARAARIIETVPKRGYRLIARGGKAAAPVAWVAAPPPQRSIWSRAVPAAVLILALGVTATLLGARLRASGKAVDPQLERRYAQARELWSRREPEGAKAARQLLEEVLVRQPDFAPAHAAMADIYVHKTGEYLGITPLQAFRAAQWHVDRAIAIDPGQPDVHVTLALLAFYRDRQPQKALAELGRALQLDPSVARAWQARGMVLSSIGEHTASVDAIRRARDLDPVSPSAAWDEVWFLYLASRFEEAHTAAARASTYSPQNYLYQALIEEGRGRREEALRLWLARLEQNGLPLPRSEEVRALAERGRYAEAYLELLRQRLSMIGPGEWGTVLAIWQLLAGDPDAAAGTLAATQWDSEHWTRIWLPQMPVFARLLSRADVSAQITRSHQSRSLPP